ncbi:MAG TPA: DUF362 domain-containing protein [Myxococcota bacterium]|nr:DUF362 domain-containing protein [Myxococcota bacterium]HRY93758.1 DUF362 domain-containing protein [Myxococcota bacterium]HSA22236.1 DUF362 domain-containing protein [Myxococcota bacterium]
MSDSSRRDFLRQAALTAAALALGRPSLSRAAGKLQLVQVRGPGVPADVAGAVKKALAPLGGMAAFVKKGARVLIKPNMGFPTAPAVRATTDPRVVAAVVREVLEAGAARVMVMDNPMRAPEACLQQNGIRAALAGLDVHVLLPMDEKFYVQVDVPRGKSLKRTRVLKEALEADVLIAAPIAKSHSAAGFSGAAKGMMGLVHDREIFHSELDLNQAVADLNTLLKAQLTVLDGLQVMTSGGPSGPGKLETTNAILAGSDLVAVDAAGVELAPLYDRKIKPRQIKHLARCQDMGVGQLGLPDDQIQRLEV